MKALTLQQPFALVGVLGIKPWETRPKPTKFRGRHLITTSANWTAEYRKYADLNIFRIASLGNEYYLGGIIGSVEITDCVTTLEAVSIMSKDVSDGKMEKWEMERAMSFGNFEAGRFAYKWERAVKFSKPIACKGALGLYDTRSIKGNYLFDEESSNILYLGEVVKYLSSKDLEIMTPYQYINSISSLGNNYDRYIHHIEKRLFKL